MVQPNHRHTEHCGILNKNIDKFHRERTLSAKKKYYQPAEETKLQIIEAFGSIDSEYMNNSSLCRFCMKECVILLGFNGNIHKKEHLNGLEWIGRCHCIVRGRKVNKMMPLRKHDINQIYII